MCELYRRKLIGLYSSSRNKLMANDSGEVDLSYTEIASRVGNLFKEENKPIAFNIIYERLGTTLDNLLYVIDRLKRANLVAEEAVNDIRFIYPLAPLFGSKSFYSKAKLIDLQLKISQQRRKIATSDQLSRLEQLRRAFPSKGKIGANSREEMNKEAEGLVENILDIAKTISMEIGTTTDNVLKGLGVHDLSLYELGIIEKPEAVSEKATS